MTLPVFPVLAGQAITVHKKPRWSTVAAQHATGRELRAPRYKYPLWDFELVFEGLDSSASGVYGGLGAASMQTLASFFLEVQGRYAPFLYADPSDSALIGAPLGVGDGTTRSFTFVRTLGAAYAEPVATVTAVSRVYLNGISQPSGWALSLPNTLIFTSAPAAGALITADFTFVYICRFSEDVQDYEEFMSLLHACRTIKFQSIRPVVSSNTLPGTPPIFTAPAPLVLPSVSGVTPWTGVPIGAPSPNRVVVAAISSRRTLEPGSILSFTIGGVAAEYIYAKTTVLDGPGALAAVGWVALAEGTSADITLTMDVAYGPSALFIYTVDLPDPFTAASAGTTGGSVSLIGSGYVFAAYAGNFGAGVSPLPVVWSGAVEDYDLLTMPAGEDATYSSAHGSQGIANPISATSGAPGEALAALMIGFGPQFAGP